MAGDSFKVSDALAIVGREPDAHGRAALLLVESLIHGLIASKLISVADAVGVVDVATEVSGTLGADLGEGRAIKQNPVHLLQAISNSLSLGLPK